MARTHTCYQHAERPVVAYCDQCARPCCRDCSLELFQQYFCERCKRRVADELRRDAVQPDAVRAVIIGAIGVVAFGFVLGPYAIWRARMASRMLERTPWMRGHWHVRAAYALAGLATLMGILTLLGRALAPPIAG